MTDRPDVPPSVRAAIEFLDYTRLVQEPLIPDGSLSGRDLIPEEAQARKAALALLTGYFKRADPVIELVQLAITKDVEDEGPGARERATVQ